MVNVHIHHRVKDFNTWKQAFDAAFDFRRDAGETSFHVYQDIDDPKNVTLWFEWENPELAERFVTSPELVRRMELAGVDGSPHVHVVREFHAMRRTAAD